jgi:PelA/Pel-15E family pectate lyase
MQYQSPQGGWPKSTDLATPPRTPDDSPPLDRGRANSLDNEATTLPMAFLARVAHATGEAKYRDSFLRGVDYLLAAQYPNGGWPQFWPLRDGYYSRITYNDGAMIRVITILRDAGGQPAVRFHRCIAGGRPTPWHAGIDCILKTQVKQDGKLIARCAARRETDALPGAGIRAAFTFRRKRRIVRFLMSIEEPTPEIVAAIEGAVAWLRSVAMKGVRLESIRGDDGRRERRLVSDPAAPLLWARFYELGTNRPLYLDRDSVFRYDFAEISHERRSGYSYHGTWGADLLARDYPRWRQKHKLPYPCSG